MTGRHGPPWDLTEPAEVERFLAELAEGAAVGEAIASMRPDGAALGRALLVHVDALEQALDSCASATACGQGLIGKDYDPAWGGPPWAPVAGTPADVEHSELVSAGWDPDFLQRGYDHDFGRTLPVVHRAADAAIDHLRAIGILFCSGGVVQPPIALARMALEASAHVVHLLDERRTAVERLVQVLNVEIVALGAELGAERRQSNRNEVRRLDREMKDLKAYALARGCQRDQGDHRCLSPKVGASVMIDHALDQAELGEAWHVLSTFVHPVGDYGWRLMLGPTASTERAHRTSMTALFVLHAIWMTVSAHRAVARYTGWDLSGADQVADPLLDLWSDGSGMRDEFHRERLSAGEHQ